MPTYQLVIAPAAMKDLKNIYQSGVQLWGENKSSHYLDNLKELFWTLTKHPYIGVQRPELLSSIRSIPFESHTLFYRVITNNIEIIRVLHSRQDPQQHL